MLAVSAVVLTTACSARYEWRELRTADYVVTLPGRWQSVTREIELSGQKVSMTMASTGIGPSVFAVGVVQLPAAAIANDVARESAIAYFRDAWVRNVGGTLVSETTIDVPRAASPAAPAGLGREIVVTGRAGSKGTPARLAARLFIVDDRFYEVVLLAAEGEVPPEALETFFTSFRVLA